MVIGTDLIREILTKSGFDFVLWKHEAGARRDEGRITWKRSSWSMTSFSACSEDEFIGAVDEEGDWIKLSPVVLWKECHVRQMEGGGQRKIGRQRGFKEVKRERQRQREEERETERQRDRERKRE
jgi:hypothetical protein